MVILNTNRKIGEKIGNVQIYIELKIGAKNIYIYEQKHRVTKMGRTLIASILTFFSSAIANSASHIKMKKKIPLTPRPPTNLSSLNYF